MPESPQHASGSRRATNPRHHALRPSVSSLLVGLLVMLVTTGLIWQVRSHGQDSLANARRSDLVEMLDQLNQESTRLEAEKARLQKTRDELASGADKQRVAREEAQRRLEVLQVLSGQVPARGPGVVVTINDPARRVDGALLLDCVEELRDSGAEAIQVGGVRLTASSWFGRTEEGPTVDGLAIGEPIVVRAIGDPHALEEALRFRGGIVSQIRGAAVGGDVVINRFEDLEVVAVATPRPLVHATPQR